MAGKPKSARPDWAKIRARYERGGISHRDLAAAEGVSYPTLRDRARRESWSISAAEVRSKVRAQASQKLVQRLSDAAVDYVQQHTDDWQRLRTLMMQGLDPKATADDVKRAALAAEFAKSYKHVQAGQRLGLGLDRKDDTPSDQPIAGLVVVPAKDYSGMSVTELQVEYDRRARDNDT